jgi:hypothetical protein
MLREHAEALRYGRHMENDVASHRVRIESRSKVF